MGVCGIMSGVSRQKQTVKQQKYLVVGAGLSGSVVARRLAEEKQAAVVVIDQRTHIGGNVYDEVRQGIHVHRYGAHIFHTNDVKVWRYLSRFTSWREYWHEVRAWIQGQLVPVPFNLNSIYQVFHPDLAQSIIDNLLSRHEFGETIDILSLRERGESSAKFLADYVYQHVFAGYTSKQWGCALEELDKCVAARVPVRLSRDNRYFTDFYQGLPTHGYTQLVKNILDHPLIEVKLSTAWTQYKPRQSEFAKIYYTGAIDEYFEYCLGELPYRSCRFEDEVRAQERQQEVAVVNYPENYDFTRIIEHKHFLDEKSPQTIITREYPEAFVRGNNERYYPINQEKNHILYKKYTQKAAAELSNRVVFLGRLGDYRYYNMDQAVSRALAMEV